MFTECIEQCSLEDIDPTFFENSEKIEPQLIEQHRMDFGQLDHQQIEHQQIEFQQMEKLPIERYQTEQPQMEPQQHLPSISEIFLDDVNLINEKNFELFFSYI